MSIRYSRRALREIRQAATWWEQNRPAAPELFRQELRHTLESLLAHPHRGQPVKSSRLPNVRRVHLSRIHYHLYYQTNDTGIVVLALWHTSRGNTPAL